MPEAALLDKYQAAKRLRMHWRSVLLFAKNGTLKATRVRDGQKNQLTTKFAAEDVERLRKDRDRLQKERAAPAIDIGEKPVKAEPKQALQRLQPSSDVLLIGLIDRLAKNTEPAKRQRPWLTVEEAAEYTGWPLRGAMELIENGQLRHLDFGRGTRGGRYRIKRADLDALEGGVAQNLAAVARR